MLPLFLISFSFGFIIYSIAGEIDIINTIKLYKKNGEYYNAITEAMRYQHLYPNGIYYPESLLLMGETYYYGGNYNKAITTMKICYNKFKEKIEGEKAILNMAYIRLIDGSPYYAYRTYQEYQFLYKNGKFKEESLINTCYSLALMSDLKKSLEGIEDYQQTFPDGKYLIQATNLHNLIKNEINRPRKNIWVSLSGSVLIPGFGHFYIGNYKTGLFSFFTNAILLLLAYDGYRDNNKFRMITFGIIEFSFYQHSIFSSISNVYKYNSNNNFMQSIRLTLRKQL